MDSLSPCRVVRLPAAVFAALVATALPAFAQAPANQRLADALFDEGKRLLKAGDVDEACPKLRESQRLDPAVGTLLFLGQCYERQGKTASAWSTFREAAAAAKTAGQVERERGAREHVARLEAILSHVVVHPLPGVGAQHVRFELDGTELSPALLDTAIPVDPGDHVIIASAPGLTTFRGVATFGADPRTTKIEIPALAPEASTETSAQLVPSASAPPSVAPPPATPGTPPAPTRGMSTSETIGWVTVGVGAVGLALSGYFALAARSTYRDSRPYCNAENHCVGAGDNLVQSARAKGNAATGLFVAGAAALGVGVTLVLTAPSNPAGDASIALGPGSVSLRGAW